MGRRLGPQATRAYDSIKGRIDTGQFAPGAQLPSQSRLAEECGVALLTVRQAIARLEDQGIVKSVHGNGTFVCAAQGDHDYPLSGPDTSSEARQADALFRAIFEGAAIGIAVTDSDGTLLQTNRAYQHMLGYDGADLTNLKYFQITHPDDVEKQARLDSQLIGGECDYYQMEKRYIHKTGALVWGLLTATRVVDVGAPRSLIIGMVEDITARKQAEAALLESEERFRASFEFAPIAMAVADLDGCHLQVNPAFCDLLGYRRDELLALTRTDITYEEDRGGADEMIRRLYVGEIGFYQQEKRYRHKDGRLVWVLATASLVRDSSGRPQYYLAQIVDIDERKRMERDLHHQALHDSLTDLPNRSLLQDRLAQAIRLAQREGASLSLLLIDLDRFKEVNDTLGHQYGDLLLQQLGPRIQPVLRKSDTIARLGGDEFALVLPGADASGGVLTARKVLSALQVPFDVDGVTLHIDASVGIATFPDHGGDTATLMRCADVAMYVAKRANASYAVYSPDLDTNSPSRLRMTNELRDAIDQGRLELHYQPKVGLRPGSVGMVEALARWRTTERGWVPPGEFIPLAEHAGLMKGLTDWALGEAVRQARVWEREGLTLRIAVNLSASSLQDDLLPDRIRALCARQNIDPSRLRVEITESAIMADPEHALSVLCALHDLNVSIALDDFGTGYSSLAYLQRLPASTIKIDRTFVKGMVHNRNDAVIVKGITEMGHALGLEVVAEGVEDLATLNALRSMGCDLAQGFFLALPMEPDALLNWYRSQQHGLASVAS